MIRTSEGEVRWMRIDDYLRRESDNGKKPVKQIVFRGDPFNVMTVRCWRLGVRPGSAAKAKRTLRSSAPGPCEQPSTRT